MQKKKGYLEEFQFWLYNIENTVTKFKKNHIPEESIIVGKCTEEEKVLLDTCYTSDDKILVGDCSIPVVSNNIKQLKFVNKNLFSKDKKNVITMSDIENILVHNRFCRDLSLFDIFEAPLTIKILPNKSSKLLADYLSKFYRSSKSIIIQDKYLNSNKDNLDQYILPYIDKDNCTITFVTSSDDSNIKHKFENYKGYKSVVKCKSGQSIHPSFIETELYKISLGYRLNIFGKNGNTSEEDIRIDKKI